MEEIARQLSLLNIVAPIWFLLLWVGYSYVADNSKGSKVNLIQIVHRYRVNWSKRMVRREDHFDDVRVLDNLLKTSTFFASTSIIILGGLVAILGYGHKASQIIATLPFAEDSGIFIWIIKTSLVLVIFIYSFFKFTWAIRQFNYAGVLVAASPLYVEDKEQKNRAAEVKRCAQYARRFERLISNAGRHFNMGLRSYYFGLVAISWYINPTLFMILSVLVVLVSYRREFMSKTLDLLS